jgi:hypothetical protein
MKCGYMFLVAVVFTNRLIESLEGLNGNRLISLRYCFLLENY